MQSLCAMMHFDFNQSDAYSYEQALQTMLRIGMPMTDLEQQFRRAVFNVIARNHDDHVKNIAYLMDKSVEWRLSPAFDVAYSYNPAGAWTSRHQMSINGKRDEFDINDLTLLAQTGGIKNKKARDIIEEVEASVSRLHDFAREAGIAKKTADGIKKAHRQLD